MSICYDFQEWTIISLAMVTVTLTVGLMMLYAYGYTDPETYRDVPELQKLFVQDNELETMLDYCYQHADRPNPVQDLVDKGLVNASYQGTECKNIKSMQDDLAVKGAPMIHEFWRTHDSDGNRLPECTGIGLEGPCS